MTRQTTTKTKNKGAIGPYLPILIFLIVGVFLGIGLFLNPHLIPSPLIGKEVPEFNLPPVQGRELGLSDADFGNGEVSILNVFASWCTACLEEHPFMMELSASGLVQFYGLNYKDSPDAAEEWLDKYGDPYMRTGADIKGRVAIDWGVYGVPETFIVDQQGKIAFKYIGPIDQKVLDEEILPVIMDLKNNPRVEDPQE